MTRFVYTSTHLAFLKTGFLKWRIPELTRRFNAAFDTQKTEPQINSCLKNHGYTCGRKGLNKGEGITLFTQEQMAFLRIHYKQLSRDELLSAVNIQFGLSVKKNQFVAFLKNHKITSGRTGFFEKGSVPFNKGTKGLMTANAGTFTKDRNFDNSVEVGTEIVNNLGYLRRKIASPNHWEFVHRLVWEEHNGAIPEGSVVRFKDGDKTNCSIENLILLSNRQHLAVTRLGYDKAPDPVKPIMLNIAKLDVKCRELADSNKAQ